MLAPDGIARENMRNAALELEHTRIQKEHAAFDELTRPETGPAPSPRKLTLRCHARLSPTCFRQRAATAASTKRQFLSPHEIATLGRQMVGVPLRGALARNGRELELAAVFLCVGSLASRRPKAMGIPRCQRKKLTTYRKLSEKVMEELSPYLPVTKINNWTSSKQL